jgi:glycosyltransferase involved in cell wall biosynthesis
VCVSEATARDVSALLDVPAPRVRVVPNGIDARFSEPPATTPVDGPYILFVGTPEPRKNLERLLDAVALLGAEGRPERLVLAGADGWGDVDLPPRARTVLLGRVADDTLRDLLAHARCIAYPSLWEGFGLVAGEALAAGAPVVCSDIPALREVAGDDAEYCDPRSVDSIAAALRRALDGPRPAPRRTLTWEAAARALADVWQELVT